jgi:pimeloyl-ACP methyl ester carboxylesterase
MNKLSLNDMELAYDRRGRGTPLLLIHGFPLDHTIWEPVVALLEGEFDLILPDLRGFGESAVSPSSYLLADLAGDLAALLDHLGLEQAVVAGHSMGGYVALAFGHAFPARTLGLGLAASQALPDAPERKASRYQEAERLLAEGVGGLAEAMSGKLTADLALQARLKALILRQPAQGAADALRAMAERPDSTPYLAEFDFPTAIVHGDADALVPLERARAVKAAVRNGILTEVPGAGHMPMMEAPEGTAGALRKLRPVSGGA